MSQTDKPAGGSISWADLTVPNAEAIRNFYSEVAGWTFEPVDMGGYSDYSMMSPESGQPVAGICHARGVNAGLPPQWLIYITVADLEQSAARCAALGGKIIVAPKKIGSFGRFCVIQDPAGAVAALFESAK